MPFEIFCQASLVTSMQDTSLQCWSLYNVMGQFAGSWPSISSRTPSNLGLRLSPNLHIFNASLEATSRLESLQHPPPCYKHTSLPGEVGCDAGLFCFRISTHSYTSHDSGFTGHGLAQNACKCVGRCGKATADAGLQEPLDRIPHLSAQCIEDSGMNEAFNRDPKH